MSSSPSSLEQAFRRAQQDVLDLSVQPGRINQLRLHALVMQATVGDVTGKRPGFSDLDGRSRWDAWHSLAGTGPEEAMREYIQMVDRLKRRAMPMVAARGGLYSL
ncbi:MAG: acyl-CoA-binding protein [Lautropia sp.]|nr:acyl-CoA-binding protein [Lautropia sp.]